MVAAHAGLAGEPVALHDGLPLRPADPVAASRIRRKGRGEPPTPTIALDPAAALLDKAAGRLPVTPSPQGSAMTCLDALGLTEPPSSKEIPDADLWLPTSKHSSPITTEHA